MATIGAEDRRKEAAGVFLPSFQVQTEAVEYTLRTGASDADAILRVPGEPEL